MSTEILIYKKKSFRNKKDVSLLSLPVLLISWLVRDNSTNYRLQELGQNKQRISNTEPQLGIAFTSPTSSASPSSFTCILLMCSPKSKPNCVTRHCEETQKKIFFLLVDYFGNKNSNARKPSLTSQQSKAFVCVRPSIQKVPG
jgi:hypothetical protein